MGEPEDKKQLASELIGIPYSDMKKFLNIHINEIPCVYLISLDYVNTLRNVMNISEQYTDNSMIFKFGFTKNFKERYSMHKSTLGKIKNVDLSLKNISIIDGDCVSNAEKDIKTTLHKYIFNYDNHEELLIIPPNNIKDVENIYSLINYKYTHFYENYQKFYKKYYFTIFIL